MFQSDSNYSKPMTFDFSTLSERERKHYDCGMEIVKRRLAAARQSEAASKADAARRNAEALTRRMGADMAHKCFGIGTTPATPSKPAQRATKTFSGHSTIKRFCSGGGLFGRI